MTWWRREEQEPDRPLIIDYLIGPNGFVKVFYETGRKDEEFNYDDFPPGAYHFRNSGQLFYLGKDIPHKGMEGTLTLYGWAELKDPEALKVALGKLRTK